MDLTLSPQMKKMLKYVGILFCIVFGWYLLQKGRFLYFILTYEPPPVAVSASTATATTWQSYLSSVGTLTAVNGVDISAEVPGIVKEIHFDAAQFVHAGDLLVLLDTAVEEAELKNNEAKLKLAQLNYARDMTLLKKNVGSQAAADQSFAQLREAEAGVEGMQARIQQKNIIAPFSGKLGIRLINIGEYVPAGTAMVTLQSLDPLYVRFSLPEQYVTDLYLRQPIDVTVDLNYSGSKTIRGQITAINSKVDQITRNVLIQGTIPNPNLQLLPGMFGLVKVWLRVQKNVIVLPETAISYSLHGDSVFLIKEKGKKKHPLLYVYRQYVEVGERRDKQVVITKGLKAGDRVVTSGQLKLQNDTRVTIDNSVEF